MKHTMKRLLCLVIWTFAAVPVVANDAASLVLVHQEEEYSAASDPTGRLTEFLGAKADVDASRTWNPGLPMPLALAELIERARTALPKPEGTFVYADPEFRAADLITSDGNLWFGSFTLRSTLIVRSKGKRSSRMVRCFARLWFYPTEACSQRKDAK
jgi:hypothetical protein